MSPIIAEIIGTAILILFGGGVVANVVLNKTKGNSSGWIVITWGWAMGVFVAVFAMGQFSGAHMGDGDSVYACPDIRGVPGCSSGMAGL
jgi:glycerol uptake facilitator protein